MGRGFFGGLRRGQLPVADWPQLPGALEPVEGLAGGIPLPTPPPLPTITGTSDSRQPPEEELLERIAAFRGAVADSLYETSKDYQVLCNLMQADLTACDEIIAELRRRLAGNIHYEVLAKLDEAHAMVVSHVGAGK